MFSPINLLVSAGVMSIAGVDITSRIVSSSITGICNIYTYLTSQTENASINKYKDDIETLDIEVKLKYVENILSKEDNNMTDNFLREKIMDTTKNINNIIKKINIKIYNHQQKYFHTWRTLDLDEDIKYLGKLMKILDERIKLYNY